MHSLHSKGCLARLSVLYVEPDAALRERLARELGSLVRELHCVADGRVAWHRFNQDACDLVITELDLPGLDGLELAESIRRQDHRVGLLIMATRAESDELLRAIPLGLVDYMLKPCSFGRLRQTLLTHARSLVDHGQGRLVRLDEDLHFLISQRVLLRGDRQIPLSPKEAALLDLLVRNRGRVVNREFIADRIWAASGELMSEAALKSLILKLRRKIGGDHIRCQYGSGYLLVDPPESQGAQPAQGDVVQAGI